MINLELFNKYTETVLDALAEEFPVKINLSLKQITGMSDIRIPDPNCDWEDMYCREAHIAICTVQWLDEHGFISGKDLNSEVLTELCLTEKGLAVLDIRPDCLQRRA